MARYLSKLVEGKNFRRILAEILEMAPDKYKRNYAFNEKDCFIATFIYNSEDFALEIISTFNNAIQAKLGIGVFGEAAEDEIVIQVEFIGEEVKIKCLNANQSLLIKQLEPKTLAQQLYDAVIEAQEKGNVYTIDDDGTETRDDTRIKFK